MSVPQVLVTGLLQLCLFAITDKENNPALQGTQALVIGILVVVIGISLGMNTGYAMNPSRDLPPRFFTYIAGWGIQVFRYCPAQSTPSQFLVGTLHAGGWGRCEEQLGRVLPSSRVAWGDRCGTPFPPDEHQRRSCS